MAKLGLRSGNTTKAVGVTVLMGAMAGAMLSGADTAFAAPPKLKITKTTKEFKNCRAAVNWLNGGAVAGTAYCS